MKHFKGPVFKRRQWLLLLAVVGVLTVVSGIYSGGFGIYQKPRSEAASIKPDSKAIPQAKAKDAKASQASTVRSVVAPTTACSMNTLNQNIIVSITQRHLWACNGATVAYESAVVTGMENLPADLTPTGTYHIYGKQTDLTLQGSDSTGSWDDPVSYWMPFLDNQYGAYGFHDATWRAASDFGAIDPYSSNASHGCVELPLTTARWLYNWVSIGTTVTIKS